MKVRFVFHKPLGERSVGKAIVAWTWVLGLFYNWRVLKYNYSHEEVWLADEGGKFNKIKSVGGYRINNAHQYLWWGQCFSSTTRGTYNGVRFDAAANVLGKHPERWDYIECEVDPERLEVAVEEAKKLVGRQYDYWGLFGFFQPFVIQDDKKWYCSEICDWFKVLLGIYPKRYRRISPRRAAYILSKKWGKPKPLR